MLTPALRPSSPLEPNQECADVRRDANSHSRVRMAHVCRTRLEGNGWADKRVADLQISTPCNENGEERHDNARPLVPQPRGAPGDSEYKGTLPHVPDRRF